MSKTKTLVDENSIAKSYVLYFLIVYQGEKYFMPLIPEILYFNGNWRSSDAEKGLILGLELHKVKVKVIQACPALLRPHGLYSPWILQARILEQVAVPFSRGSS